MLHKRWTFIQPDVRNCGKGILKMKKILSFVLMMCVLMTIPMFAFAAVSGDEPLTIGTPFMITNAGQGPGGKMGRLLVSRAGTLTEDEDFYYVDVPYAADVDARDYRIPPERNPHEKCRSPARRTALYFRTPPTGAFPYTCRSAS